MSRHRFVKGMDIEGEFIGPPIRFDANYQAEELDDDALYDDDLEDDMTEEQRGTVFPLCSIYI